MPGLNAAFNSFDAKGKNPRWSRSARSEDGTTVVMALWKDRFDYKATPVRYSSMGQASIPGWTEKPGNVERIENLKWARDHCGGLFKVVIVVAKDPDARPRDVAEAYPRPNMVMRLIELNEATGEFVSELLV